MIENFKIAEPLFEGQFRECQQFWLTINGEEFKGLYKDDEINWYHPQPTHEESHRAEIEGQVFSLMSRYLQ